ncbi:hypothetical protein KY309_01265 [Candidatus Woesearchaeota archaeon]|nr:hypothetical protein [Candidatus Woesearchaeota archaeon]MBW3016221.1 hypothetical protein [Candidatus Woesearchaeota archaeon]
MAVRKLDRFVALEYDSLPDIPVLRFEGGVSANSRPYAVYVETFPNGAVSVDLSDENGSFNFIMCTRGLISIRCDDKYLSKKDFLEVSGLSASDVSGLARILKRESKALFGSSADYMRPCLDKISGVPFLTQFRAVLHDNLEPLLEKLEVPQKYRPLIYDAAARAYDQFNRSM